MNVLITGAKGFVGKNLVENLKNIRDDKNRTRPELEIDNIYEYDIDCDISELEKFCKDCDFVFNLAGVNRPSDNSEFYTGNADFSSLLLSILKKNNNTCPVMLSSSIQATLIGRYGESDYGKSKAKAEEIFFAYGKENNVPVYVYRFPNLFGKWCRPSYNSVIATFCYNVARDLPITVNDEKAELTLLYIDDLVDEMLNLLSGKKHTCRFEGLDVIEDDAGKYCFVPGAHKATLGEIRDMLYGFSQVNDTITVPAAEDNSFIKKLWSTYLSYLPKEKMSFPLKVNSDARGSFTELLKTKSCGQFSVNISNPGITKGQHWHNSKWEFFIVVSGEALIEERKIGSDEVISFKVTGEEPRAVYMLPGYTHNIINLSDTEKLITLMWANERFDSAHPDTFGEKV